MDGLLPQAIPGRTPDCPPRDPASLFTRGALFLWRVKTSNQGACSCGGAQKQSTLHRELPGKRFHPVRVLAQVPGHTPQHFGCGPLLARVNKDP